MSNIARKKGREGSTGPKYVKMCQKFPYFWCQKRDPQNAFFLLSTGTIIATNTVQGAMEELAADKAADAKGNGMF